MFCLLLLNRPPHRCVSRTGSKNGCHGFLDWTTVWISYPGIFPTVIANMQGAFYVYNLYVHLNTCE